MRLLDTGLTRALLLRRGWAVLAALAVAGAILVSGATPATAHASLRETTPFDGQTVAEAPGEVRWTFNEEVTSTSGALRIFDSSGQRVDTGEQTQPAPDQLTVGMRDDVGSGSFVATYRVASADGHLIRGAFVFQVGDGATIDDDTVAAIFAGGQDTVVAMAAGVTRAAGYLGALVLGGALLWSIVVTRRRHREEQARGDRWAARGAWLAAAAAVVVIPVQAMLNAGAGLGVLADSRVLAETLTAPVGTGALLRLVAAAVVVVLLRRGTERSRDLAGLAALVVLGSFLVDGHTRTVDPGWLMLLGDAVHLMAGAAWLGGLVVLGATVRAARLEDDPVGAAEVVARFSRVATWSLVAVTLAGSAMSWAAVRQPRALVSTDYGWTLLVKVALVAVVIVLGVYNNRRLVPAITRAAAPAGAALDATGAQAPDSAVHARIGRAAWSRLGAIVRFEAGVLVAVLAVTAFLVNLRPAADEAGITGAFDTLVAIDDELQLNLVVDPNRVGYNDIHFYVLDRTGRPHGDLESVQVELTQPQRDIGPIVREPFVAGPGHWQLESNDLVVPGEWVIELVVGTDRFTEERVAVPVVVNP